MSKATNFFFGGSDQNNAGSLPGAVKLWTDPVVKPYQKAPGFYKESRDADKALGKQKTAAAAATEAAKTQADLADQAFNKANQKQPNISSFWDANAYGSSATMLTGAGGVDPNKLLLGKTTLLGS